jgi:hypothetical protein
MVWPVSACSAARDSKHFAPQTLSPDGFATQPPLAHSKSLAQRSPARANGRQRPSRQRKPGAQLLSAQGASAAPRALEQAPCTQLCSGAQLTLAAQAEPSFGMASHLWLVSEQKSVQNGCERSNLRTRT